jgi:hypothetical protein
VTSLAAAKPGWTSRVFGIESGRLVACDARFDGGEWRRGEDGFEFLYRGTIGGFYVLRAPDRWDVVSRDVAAACFRRLPIRLVSEADALAEATRAG